MPLAKGRTPPPRGKRPPPKQYTAMHRVADAAVPKLAAAVQAGLHHVALQRVTLKALAAGFASGNTADAVHAIPWGGLENDLYRRFVPVLHATVVDAAKAFVPLAKAKPTDASLAYAFDVTNPRAMEWARLTASHLALDLAAESQQAVRSMVVRMFEEGIPPIEAARRLRSAIGLNRQWTDALARYQQGLRANAIPIPEDVQTKLVQRYADRALQHRAEVIARTESARAAVKGQQLLWHDQIDRGLLDADRVRQVWLVTPDERLCPMCASIPGSRNQPAVGDDFYVPYTGDTVSGPPLHPQCRCDVALLVANADGTWPAPPSLLEEILAYAGADGPPASRTLAPAIPAAYR